MDDYTSIAEEISNIKERNARVAADKAWETSSIRIGTIAVTTYAFAALALWITGVPHLFLAALIPVLGFVLSTQSLPPLKRWWIGKYLNKHQ